MLITLDIEIFFTAFKFSINDKTVYKLMLKNDYHIIYAPLLILNDFILNATFINSKVISMASSVDNFFHLKGAQQISFKVYIILLIVIVPFKVTAKK